MNDSIKHRLEAALAEAVFVLTGPTSGLGLALFHHLRSADAAIVAIGRDIDRLAADRDAAPGDNRRVTLIEADFAAADPAAWLDASRKQAGEMLAIHPGRHLVVISNAGSIVPLCAAADLDADALVTAMRINLVAPVALATTMLRQATQSGRRLRIANVTTGAAQRPIAGWLAYCASKAACRMALDVLAIENPGVELVHLDPGLVDTGMQAAIREKGAVVERSAAPAGPAQLRSPAVVAQDLMARMMGMTR